ncbi:MAG: uracil-DNA glycosylase [Pseudomonadota bacterium]
MDDRPCWSELARDLKVFLDYMGTLGVVEVPAVEPGPLPQAKPSAPPPDPPATLEALREEARDCTRCRLCRGRRNVVFGEGSGRSGLMFIADRPGEEDDRAGRPFAGPDGALLTNIIVKGMKLAREDCHLTYLVKCHSREMGEPTPSDAKTCRQFLPRQIALIKPKVIVALGEEAAQALLGENKRLGQLRNRFIPFQGIPVMTTFHPAFLLEHPERKGQAWDDIKMALERLNRG